MDVPYHLQVWECPTPRGYNSLVTAVIVKSIKVYHTHDNLSNKLALLVAAAFAFHYFSLLFYSEIAHQFKALYTVL